MAELFAGFLVALAIIFVVTTVSVVLAVAATRRLVVLIQRRILGVIVPTAPVVSFAGVRRGGPDAFSWPTVAPRRRLWRAVRSAEQAVAHATAAGAPVGDLPSLCRRLRTAALGVDRAICAAGASGGVRRPLPPDVARELEDVVTAARGIHGNAVAAITATSRHSTSALVLDVHTETQALAAGLRSPGDR
jgi:hypothetical protein